MKRIIAEFCHRLCRKIVFHMDKPCNDDDAVRRKKNQIQGGFGLLSLG